MELHEQAAKALAATIRRMLAGGEGVALSPVGAAQRQTVLEVLADLERRGGAFALRDVAGLLADAAQQLLRRVVATGRRVRQHPPAAAFRAVSSRAQDASSGRGSAWRSRAGHCSPVGRR